MIRIADENENPNPGENDGNDQPSKQLPAESLERGSHASEYVDNDDAPEGAIAQQEVLPDEQGD